MLEKEYLLEQNKKLKDEIVKLRRQIRNYKFDNLTGLHLRSDFNEMVDTLWYEYEEFTHPFTMVMIDLNGLHALNRDVGFEAGDTFILNVSNVLKDNFKECFIYRIGGDEFMMLKKGTNLMSCQEKLAQLENVEYGVTSTDKNYEGIADMFNAVDSQIIKKKTATELKTGVSR